MKVTAVQKLRKYHLKNETAVCVAVTQEHKEMGAGVGIDKYALPFNMISDDLCGLNLSSVPVHHNLPLLNVFKYLSTSILNRSNDLPFTNHPWG